MNHANILECKKLKVYTPECKKPCLPSDVVMFKDCVSVEQVNNVGLFDTRKKQGKKREKTKKERRKRKRKTKGEAMRRRKTGWRKGDLEKLKEKKNACITLEKSSLRPI